MKGGLGSGVSVPLLLKIETLRLAMLFGLDWNPFSCPWKAVPSKDANCASDAMTKTSGSFLSMAVLVARIKQQRVFEGRASLSDLVSDCLPLL